LGRFSHAISEGDGISIIPVIEGDVAALAARAEEAGAEAVAIRTPDDVTSARARSGLPILLRRVELDRDAAPNSDAYVLAFGDWADSEELEQVHSRLVSADVDCVVDVRDEDELREALERIDPEIIMVSERDLDPEDDPLERVLDLLPDVPAGKLVIAEVDALGREQVLALERAGIDAVLVHNLAGTPDFSRAVEDLVGGPRAGR
jgi:indole-3-glycerol phosphate synthase